MGEITSSPECNNKKSLIVSLLGPTASGKSTLSEVLTDQLMQIDVTSVVIKKDDAIRKLAVEQHGDGQEAVGYTPFRSFGELDVNMEINRQILKQIGFVDVIILEGGTRTRRAAETTLKNTEDVASHVIIKLDISPGEVFSRLRRRKREQALAGETRVDDSWSIALGKLTTQYLRPVFVDSPSSGDSDVEVVNANANPENLATEVYGIINNWLTDYPVR